MQKLADRWNQARIAELHLFFLITIVNGMHKELIKVPEKGTYKWQLFNYWSDEYRQTHADHSAYIALNFAGALDACRSKLQHLVQHHRMHAHDSTTGARHNRAIERLQNTMTGAAVSYESCFRRQ
jgi:hypothetical protein